jgi:hypothetical protein
MDANDFLRPSDLRLRNDARAAVDRLADGLLDLLAKERAESEAREAMASEIAEEVIREVLDALPGKPQMGEGETLGDVVRRAIVEATRG